MLTAEPMSSELRRFRESLFRVGEKWELQPLTLSLHRFDSRSGAAAPEDLAVFHYELQILECLGVSQWIGVHGDNVGKCAWRHHADLAFHVEHDGGTRGCALNGV